MKKCKLFAALFAAAAFLALLPGANAIKAKAAEPVTYAVYYQGSNKTWYYQKGTNSFNEDDLPKKLISREVYYLRTQELQEGDIVVVLNEQPNAEPLNLGNVRLGELWVGCKPENFTIVYTGGIDNLYVLKDSKCSINGDVTFAHIYDPTTANINGNVTEMILENITDDSPDSNVSCSGTVGHLTAPSSTQPRNYYNLYDFKKDTLLISEGTLKTDYWNYSTEPSVSTSVSESSQSSLGTTYVYNGIDYSLVFDPAFYVREYADLNSVYGADNAALFQHFVTNGMNEGRQGTTAFDPAVYKENYPDLQAAFGNDWAAYYQHYINNGKAEGRIAY